MAIKTPEELSAILSSAIATARKDRAIDEEITTVQWASSADTWFVYALSKVRGTFNAFAISSEDGQAYRIQGAAPKRSKKTTLLAPAQTMRRGKPIGTRNILTDADWLMKTALETHGTFIRIGNFTVVSG
jgi:hypothetical protein